MARSYIIKNMEKIWKTLFTEARIIASALVEALTRDSNIRRFQALKFQYTVKWEDRRKRYVKTISYLSDRAIYCRRCLFARDSHDII